MKEALKLALEALELVSIEFVCNGAHHAKKDRHDWLESCPVVERYQAAITAVKEALAQDELCSSQEPVAWCQLSLGGRSIAYFDGKPIIMTGKVGNDCHTTPLYTAPPKRPWVGLTDDETKEQIKHSDLLDMFEHIGWYSAPRKGFDKNAILLIQAIEAKLKELNI